MQAAEYVRMSTDFEQYSIVNQKAAIAVYAAQHDFEIVKTYADPAKSGLDLKHRPGLQSLIDDVLSGRADFQAVLVLDISRWGRFQDSDEAACYEFLCKRAGISVHYCAEPFPNDGSSTSTVLKMVKRMMAAEYLRELSAKVHAGQCRLASHGFKQGGTAGYGLRRLLLDSEGNPKMILQTGERKSLTTERVTYALGPEEEVGTVREVFSMFLDQGLPLRKIARLLNERGVRNRTIGAWDHMAVLRLLTHPRYVGCAVFNRKSQTLRGKILDNPREQWVLRASAFPAIIPQDMFDRTQVKLSNMVARRSDSRLLEELRDFVSKYGKPLPHSTRVDGMATICTYVYRFGSMRAAYDLINYEAPGCLSAADLETRRRVAALRLSVMADIRQRLCDARVQFVEGKRTFRVREKGLFLFEIGRCFLTPKGDERWTVRVRTDCSKHSLVVVRLTPKNDGVLDFIFLANAPKVTKDFTLSDKLVQASGTICNSTAEVVNALSI